MELRDRLKQLQVKLEEASAMETELTLNSQEINDLCEFLMSFLYD